MKSVRKNVFETNSSSTHSLTLVRSYVDEKYRIPYDETIVLGEIDGSEFLNVKDSVTFTGFCDKLTCLIAFIISYYEDYVEMYNFDVLYSRFLKCCHYIWVCELLKEKYNITLSLREFRESGVILDDNFFEEMQIPYVYPEDFKNRIDEIISNPDIALEYYNESY